VRWYIVDLRCPKCDKVHRVSTRYWVHDGPTKAGSLADLYPDGNLPRDLVLLLAKLVWCPTVEQWVNQTDHAQVFLRPLRAQE
jgi:hypothetical protein